MQIIYKFLATGAFISYIPPLIFKFKKNTGAGFLGTLWGIPLVLCLPENGCIYTIFLLIFLTFAVFICKKVEFKGYVGHDNPKIIIDEVAGYLMAMFLLPHLWQYLLSAFVLFRTFDTIKPLFVKTFDKMDNSFGVVFDDVAAGLLANILIHAFRILVIKY